MNSGREPASGSSLIADNQMQSVGTAGSVVEQNVGTSSSVGTSDCFVIIIDVNAHDWYSLEAEEYLNYNTSNVVTTGTNTNNAKNSNPNNAPQRRSTHDSATAASMSVPTGIGTGTNIDSPNNNINIIGLTFEDVIRSVFYFTAATSFCWRHRRLTIIAADGRDAVVVYDAIPTFWNFDRKLLVDKVLTHMNKFIQSPVPDDGTQLPLRSRCDSKMSFAIGAALCMISKRLLHAVEPRQGRILLLDVAPSDSYAAQYSSLTKLSFAALKLGVPVDVCSLRHCAAPAALQQLAELSRGHHLEFQTALKLHNYIQNCTANTSSATANTSSATPNNGRQQQPTNKYIVLTGISDGTDTTGGYSSRHSTGSSTGATAVPGSFLKGALAQFLMFHFGLPASSSSGVTAQAERNATTAFSAQSGPFAGKPHGMTTATSLTVEFGVVCSCHGRAVDFAKVCSCCLALYCEAGGNCLESCIFCKSKFTEG